MSIYNVNFIDNSRKAYKIYLPGMVLYFSYETLIGVHCSYNNKNARLHNQWGPTTGRHINKLGIRDWEEVSVKDLNKLMFSAIADTGIKILDKRIKGEMSL